MEQYGNTWWGEQWLNALKHIDYSNRLPRGASYARRGLVHDITIEGNVIRAKVQGRQPRPYSEKVSLARFTKRQIEMLVSEISRQPVIVSRLLNRQLDPAVADIAQQAGVPLFPTKWSDLGMDCSCPDFAVPCKHLAAVIYKISMELDTNPFLIFTLHGMDLEKELTDRGLSLAGEAMAVEDISVFLGMDMPCLRLEDTGPEPAVLDYTKLPDLALPLSNLLPDSPSFYHSGDFKPVYQKELTCVCKAAAKILQGRLQLADDPAASFDRRTEAAPERLLDFELWQALLNLPAEALTDLQPSMLTLRKIVKTVLHFVARGCVVPQICASEVRNSGRRTAKTSSKTSYSIVWQPALMDTATAELAGQLNQEPALLNRCLTALVPVLAHPADEDDFRNLFFCGEPQVFDGIGEAGIAGAIRSWLDRFYVQRACRLAIHVDELPRGNRMEADFAVRVRVDDQDFADVMREIGDPARRTDVLRQLALLCDLAPDLATYVNNLGVSPLYYTLASFAPFLTQVLPAMRLLGVAAVMPRALSRLLKPRVSLALFTESGNVGRVSAITIKELLRFDWRVAVGDVSLSVEEFEQFMDKAGGLMRFKERYVYMDADDLRRLTRELENPPALKSAVLLQAALSGTYQGAPVTMTDEVRALLKELTTLPEERLPQGLQAELRPYQKRGYAWLYHTGQLGFGSILADDMGLGKTLQTIAFLLRLKEDGVFQTKKSLVVVPTGLMNNWQEEIARFAPDLITAVYHGPDRDLKHCDKADVVITTYGVARADVARLKKMRLAALVIDEAQNIKNSGTAQSKALRSIPADRCVALSGTPVENRLSDYWSIMDFANRGYLGTLKAFDEEYVKPIQADGDWEKAEQFKKITAPFLMRRLKTDKTVISDLPDKIERNAWAALTPEQASLYQETVNRCMAVIEPMEGDDSETLFKRKGLVLQMLLALKQICNHPTQYLKDGRYDAELSGKTMLLLDLLDGITAANEKVLVFTQFVEMGELLQGFIQKTLGEQPMFYHGGCSLKQRQEMVERFQNSRADRVFLLSLKAAGTGLNLTAASHVIHYDLWWNPAVEAQATDRAYRIGQHKNVQVHRMITRDTFEERINRLIQSKRDLAELTVASGENWIGSMTNRELRELFG